MMIKVSVISPIYNRQDWVENLLTNLRMQTLENIEFIIVDDGSADNTYECLYKQVKHDKRFCIIKNSENRGPYHARNIGLQKARGEYIGFFDSDDRIPEDYFQSLYEQAKTQRADIVYTSYNNIAHNISKIENKEDKFKVLKNGSLCDKLYKRRYLQKNNILFTEGLYTADNLFVLQSFMKTDNIILTMTPNYEYNLQTDSISTDIAKQKKRKEDIIKVLDKALDIGKQSGLSEWEEYYFQQFLIRSLCSYAEDKKFKKRFYKILKQKSDFKNGITLKLKILKIIRFFHLISKSRYKILRQIELVKTSPLFDAKWYLIQNPDVKNKQDAAAHYVKTGWKKGKNPSREFDGFKYLKTYPEVAKEGICPLVHYIICGQYEGRCFVSVK